MQVSCTKLVFTLRNVESELSRAIAISAASAGPQKVCVIEYAYGKHKCRVEVVESRQRKAAE